jgi:hypothetical protein
VVVRGLTDHRWLERSEPHFKIESGEAVLHHQCVRCGRDIVTVVSTGTRHAVHVCALVFNRLDDTVTERWLSESCPGRRLASDDDDRKRLLTKIPVFSSRGLRAVQPRVRLAR